MRRAQKKKFFHMWEKALIEYGAATLAALKTACLFRIAVPNWRCFWSWVRRGNARLCKRGVCLTVLCVKKGEALVYLWRRAHLAADLQKAGVARFLRECGYTSCRADLALTHLRARFGMCVFPHEIGVFLGYPLGDVIGFIDNAGKNWKYMGCWKVYCDARQTREIFARIAHCREEYMRLWRDGVRMEQLIVHT